MMPQSHDLSDIFEIIPYLSAPKPEAIISLLNNPDHEKFWKNDCGIVTLPPLSNKIKTSPKLSALEVAGKISRGGLSAGLLSEKTLAELIAAHANIGDPEIRRQRLLDFYQAVGISENSVLQYRDEICAFVEVALQRYPDIENKWGFLPEDEREKCARQIIHDLVKCFDIPMPETKFRQPMSALAEYLPGKNHENAKILFTSRSLHYFRKFLFILVHEAGHHIQECKDKEGRIIFDENSRNYLRFSALKHEEDYCVQLIELHANFMARLTTGIFFGCLNGQYQSPEEAFESVYQNTLCNGIDFLTPLKCNDKRILVAKKPSSVIKELLALWNNDRKGFMSNVKGNSPFINSLVPKLAL